VPEIKAAVESSETSGRRDETFRPTLAFWLTIVSGTLLACGFIAGQIWLWFNPAPTFEAGPLELAVFGGCLLFFSFLAVLGLATVATSIGSYVRIVTTQIEVKTTFTRPQFGAAEIEQITWKAHSLQGATIVCTTGGHAVPIYLERYGNRDRLGLIRLLRAFDIADQIGWPAFCRAVANPLRERIEPRSLELEPLAPEEFLSTRARYDRIARVAIPISVFVAALLAWMLSTATPFGMVLLLLICWLLVRFTTPPGGKREKLLSVSRRRIAASVLGCCGVMLLLGILHLLGIGETATIVTISLFGVACLALCVAAIHQEEKEQQRQLPDREAEASLRWEQLESAHPAG
jgi:nitrate reductase gamma subunit